MIFWSTFGVFAICLTLESITSWMFIWGSKKKHPELWEHSGEPTLMGNGDLINAWPLNKYLMQRQYKEIDNEAAKAFAESLRLPFVLSYISAIVSVVVFFVCLFIFGKPE
ncbi:hypothetical protein [Shewanella sp. NIFS-20-20]|uniref:hypothetical protein n=1 Tax=Shewanella sp. NIFS-20-20 TaxID=2853806 RepID=UPI001C481B73|nr:hypothetical protein [Shewanella sp. NIFS-20-20]MBV7314290.1 hypothetical protein [Shewanella sp. NIFS-20-20]MBV7317626.1 hypothetical protein [Shewanella sp. NIFS-20-20]